MYRIIGADGAEYGPYSVDDLRKLILEFRANAATNARPEAGGDWRPLSDYAEFAEALQAAAATAPNRLIVRPTSVDALNSSAIMDEA